MSIAARRNRVELEGVIAVRGALRHTPAGLPALEFGLAHESRALEAGRERDVTLEIDAIAFDAVARLLAAAPAGAAVRATGFLCARSRRSKKPVLHVMQIEFLQGV